MDDLRGKTAFITGGASGIGLALAEAFGREGMNVVIADIEKPALDTALEALRAKQVRCEGVECDVASRASVDGARDVAVAAFGKVHVVCNNAGVAAGGMVGTIPEKDWQWILGVNLMGVVHGMDAFTPHMMAHGEGGHFVNTASLAGMVSAPGIEPYTATKFAVVAMSEGWALQLSASNIGVSVLCPAFVKTRIHQSGRNRQDATGESVIDSSNVFSAAVEGGIPAEPVARRVVEAIKANELYIFTHAGARDVVAARFQRILEAYDRIGESQALASLAPGAGVGPLRQT